MKLINLLLFIILCSFTALSQGDSGDDDFLFVELECKAISKSDKGMEGVSMKVYQSGKLVEETLSDSLGSFKNISIFYNIKLLIEFSKLGYVTKSIEVDTYIEKTPKSLALNNIFPCDFTMLKARKGKDYSIISGKPVAAIVVDKRTGELDYNKAYIKKRSKEIEEFYKNK